MKRTVRLPSYALLALATLLSLPGPAVAEDTGSANVLFIFDSSGSMNKKLETGETRSEAAKRAMTEALSQLPAEASPGLMMYGHRRAKDCSDIEAVAPIGALSGADIAGIIASSKPKGETPIADSLMRAAAGFSDYAGQSNSIVLVTDGIEECGGDPCAAARAIDAMGLSIKAHVVGFTLNAEQRATMQCIADVTGGTYFDAQDSESLTAALQDVQAQVAPPAPTFTSLFRDDFDGTALQPHWSVSDGRPDSFIVETGRLLVVSARSPTDEGSDTLFALTAIAPPAEDWIAQAVVEFGIQTAEDGFAISLVKEGTTISAELGAKGDKYDGWTLFARVAKTTNGETTAFEVPISEVPCNLCTPDTMLPALAAKVKQPIELQLVREGRNYHARAREAGGETWLATDEVTLLSGSGGFALSGFQRKPNDGESYAFVDSFEILKKD